MTRVKETGIKISLYVHVSGICDPIGRERASLLVFLYHNECNSIIDVVVVVVVSQSGLILLKDLTVQNLSSSLHMLRGDSTVYFF